jgi:hypothetical protein
VGERRERAVNSNPADDEVYSIQHYVIMLFSELRKVDGFRWALRFLYHCQFVHRLYI